MRKMKKKYLIFEFLLFTNILFGNVFVVSNDYEYYNPFALSAKIDVQANRILLDDERIKLSFYIGDTLENAQKKYEYISPTAIGKVSFYCFITKVSENSPLLKLDFIGQSYTLNIANFGVKNLTLYTVKSLSIKDNAFEEIIIAKTNPNGKFSSISNHNSKTVLGTPDGKGFKTFKVFMKAEVVAIKNSLPNAEIYDFSDLSHNDLHKIMKNIEIEYLKNECSIAKLNQIRDELNRRCPKNCDK